MKLQRLIFLLPFKFLTRILSAFSLVLTRSGSLIELEFKRITLLEVLSVSLNKNI